MRTADLGSIPVFAMNLFSGPICQILGTPKATGSGAFHSRVSAGTDGPGVSLP